MTRTPEQLLQRIRLGEDSRLELQSIVFAGRKVKGPSRDVIADALEAFANTRRARLWIDAARASRSSRAGSSGSPGARRRSNSWMARN